MIIVMSFLEAQSQRAYYRIGRGTIPYVKIIIGQGNQPYNTCFIINRDRTKYLTAYEVDEYKPKYGNRFISTPIDDKKYFLEELVAGELSLFKLIDDEFRTRFFVKFEGQELIEMQNNSRRQNDYRKILESSWVTCEVYREVIKLTEFTKLSLTRAIKTHNGCTEPYIPTKQHRFAFGISPAKYESAPSNSAVAAIPIGSFNLFPLKRKPSFYASYSFDQPLGGGNAYWTLGGKFHYISLNQPRFGDFGDVVYDIQTDLFDIGIPIGLKYIQKVHPKITLTIGTEVIPSYFIKEDVALIKSELLPTGEINRRITKLGASTFGVGYNLNGGVNYLLSDKNEISFRFALQKRYSYGDRVFNIDQPHFEIGYIIRASPHDIFGTDRKNKNASKNRKKRKRRKK